jgi:hypothetical protein
MKVKKKIKHNFHIRGYMLQQSRIESGHLEKINHLLKKFWRLKILKEIKIFANLKKRSSFGETKNP